MKCSQLLSIAGYRDRTGDGDGEIQRFGERKGGQKDIAGLRASSQFKCDTNRSIPGLSLLPLALAVTFIISEGFSPTSFPLQLLHQPRGFLTFLRLTLGGVWRWREYV